MRGNVGLLPHRLVSPCPAGVSTHGTSPGPSSRWAGTFPFQEMEKRKGFTTKGMTITFQEACDNIKTLMEISKEYGIEINKEKSQIIIHNAEHKLENIKEIRVTNNIKYLGVIITEKRDIFKE